MGWQQIHVRGVVTKTRRRDGIQPMVFSGYIDQSAEKRGKVAVLRSQSAPAAIAHAATWSVPESVVMAGTHAGRRGAGAGLRLSAQGSPPHAGGEQRGNGQNGQESGGYAHVF